MDFLDEQRIEIQQAVNSIQTIRRKPLLLLYETRCSSFPLIKVHKDLAGNFFDELDVVIQTRQGSPRQGFLLTKILRQFSKKINVLVPLYAKGLGIFPCLTADELTFTYLGELGPLECPVKIADHKGDKIDASALLTYKSLTEIPKLISKSASILREEIGFSEYDMKSEAVALAGNTMGSTIMTIYKNLSPLKIGEMRNELDSGLHYLSLALMRYKKLSRETANEVAMKFLYDYPGQEAIIDALELEMLGIEITKADDQLEAPLISLGSLLSDTHYIELIELFPGSANKTITTDKNIANP